jgi:hypothetical protein
VCRVTGKLAGAEFEAAVGYRIGDIVTRQLEFGLHGVVLGRRAGGEA